jgi:3-deoxy-D-manno-octulosonic-acid transferase
VSILVDIAYLIALPFVIAFAAISRLKGHPARKDLNDRLGAGVCLERHPKRVLLHAVSVGEVNAIRTLVSELKERSFDVVICVTTDTGLQRAKELFGHDHTITRYPVDFSFSIRRFLNRTKPTVIALVELEVWPNLVGMSFSNGIPVVVINGRLSERSYRRYKFARPFLQNTFSKLSAIGMQNELYASRVRDLGGQNVTVEGTMKWDNAVVTDEVDGASDLAENLGIDRSKPLVVIGSSTPEEHNLLLSAIPEQVQLLCAPRRPEWFDEAEQTLAPCNRRTSKERCKTSRFLLDTFGELDKAYSLADIVVIGRSFAPMHGSDPVQPIAFGKPTIIGPNVSDFEDMVHLLTEGEGLIQCYKDHLAAQIRELLEDQNKCETLARNGRAIIASQQGATRRYEQLIMDNTP